MVWGGISHGFKTPLVVINGALNGLGYRDNILIPHAIPFVEQHNLIMQQNNARPHVARVCCDAIQTSNIQTLVWPPYSADLSPIEHLWDDLGRKIRNRNPAPHNVAELTAAFQDEWQNIPMRTVNHLKWSMHRRIRAAIAARGGHIRY